VSDSQAQRLLNTAQTEGWSDLLSILDEQILDRKESLFRIAATKPDALTGRKAVSMAAGAMALLEFKESLLGKISTLTQRGRV